MQIALFDDPADKVVRAPLESRTVIYTDGSCLKGSIGGWGWVAADGREGSGCAAETTNQRMEVQAALQGILATAGPVHIVSDSKYLVSAFNEGWARRWEANGWRTAKRNPVANQDLFRPLAVQVRDRDVTFEWVKGHTGVELNERADELAGVAAAELAAAGRERCGS